MKRIAIIGSTGSIGKSTLEVVRHLKDQFEVVGLAAGSNKELFLEQIKEFNPKVSALYNPEKAKELGVLSGIEGVVEVATHPDVDFVVLAMTGTLGLIPAMRAIDAGKDIGLANKEALVSGGSLVMEAALKKRVKILPIDSEHSAIFQCLNGENPKTVSRLILTSSGGPFRSLSREELSRVTVDQALNHPTWKMGSKITIDSSTLMNKGLEVIEAHYLFSMPLTQIDVVIHPQSIIHSMVEFQDGSIMAQMGEPLMITPIQYALTYPDRCKGILKPFDFVKNSKLDFMVPDKELFRCLGLAYETAKSGQSYPCYMNAANEILVNRCLDRQISWQEISLKLDALIQSHKSQKINSLEDILEVDLRARKEALNI